MNQTKQQHAYQRGARIARLWKKVKGSVLHWDERCVTWANKKHLPPWIGHAPIIIFIAFFISTIAFGSLIIAACFLLIFAVACIIQNPGSSQATADEAEFYDDTEKTGPGYRYGQEGHGYYSGSDDITSERLD
ncbi:MULTISPECIES: hypothetical protein [Brenneria]|uniref:DUF3742 domain-containing protein n=1 Tax=Brenneria nigrifluens DSM 30175 = ATCC 13028 TaxID=1121120 RepID=A0A2U1UH65_9GAMM|nr:MULTISPECIES: hypothetical protein [Brenneria]EHD22932.1 hypothetical protein BrE312_3579 [Brenneria sp. EniD312]PWC21026.1 hypothetical protein DDT54_19755 [Brenneria nigrifluens DSM 30175 = ATCC 13028]QCR06130.1 hypothetical protein EH206_19365 [Brenneria nigrifluens DSM 30175 = ATCC 13028]